MSLRKARVLAACIIEGLVYKPDQVIEADAALIKDHVKAGDLDDNKDAVAYCETELGVKALRHEAEAERAAAADRAARAEQLAGLRAQHDAETDAATKAALAEQIAALEASLK